MILLKSFRANKINEIMVTSKKVATNCTCLVTSVLGQYVTRGPPVGHAGLRRDECRRKQTVYC